MPTRAEQYRAQYFVSPIPEKPPTETDIVLYDEFSRLSDPDVAKNYWEQFEWEAGSGYPQTLTVNPELEAYGAKKTRQLREEVAADRAGLSLPLEAPTSAQISAVEEEESFRRMHETDLTDQDSWHPYARPYGLLRAGRR